MLWLLFYNEGKRAGGFQAGERPAMKRHKRVEALKKSKILEGKIAVLPVQKIVILTPERGDTVRYFGRQGMAELFQELVNSKSDTETFNVSLIGHPGAGKSNLVWAVAHHLVTQKKETVLWASRREFKAKWELRLFAHDGKNAHVYELENAPKKLSDILKEAVLANLSVLILDAPTVSKSETSADGVAAFEWAGPPPGRDKKPKRRVIHTSSLKAFSTDERTCTGNFLYNKTMRPWTRLDFVHAMNDEALKAQVCKTLDLEPAGVTPEEVVDKKLFYSGINARWFFNFSIEKIKEESKHILDRMESASTGDGISSERAVNSAYVTFWVEERRITLFTSQYLAHLLGRNGEGSTKFFELFPIMKDRLGNGAPGEIFEADFLMNLEHCHNIADAQRAVMGNEAQPVDVLIGVDLSNGNKVRWRTGKLFPLPKSKGDDLAAQPIHNGAAPVTHRVSQWFVPEDKNQPFLDFFVLVPGRNDSSWTLKVIQNTVGKKHSADLKQLKRVLMGVENAGYSLNSIVVVAFVIENTSQNKLGSSIDGADVKVTIPCSTGSPKRLGRRNASTMKNFKIEVLRIVFTRTGAAP
jgi:hypothetical protein